MNEPVAETVDDLLRNVVGALNGLRFSTHDLESRDVVSCSRSLPCVVNIKLSKDRFWSSSSTLVRSEIKHILTGRRCFPNKADMDKPYSEDSYLTYVEVGIKQTTTTAINSLLKSWVFQAVVVSVSVWLLAWLLGIGCPAIVKWMGA